MTDAVPFRRTVWSTTIDSGEERADCAIWSGPAAGVARILLRLRLEGAEVGSVRVAPRALASNDGEDWTLVTWVGSAPSIVVDQAERQLGPFAIDPFHGKRLLRVTLGTESTACELVVGAVVGTLHLIGP